MRSRLAALLLAAIACGTPARAAAAEPPPATPFPRIQTEDKNSGPHKLALGTAIVGVVLVGASFPLAAEADRLYEEYLVETDVDQIEDSFQATLRMDNLAKASLLAGEVLLAAAVWMRFVHSPSSARVATVEPGEPQLRLDVRPDRCALALRF